MFLIKPQLFLLLIKLWIYEVDHARAQIKLVRALLFAKIMLLVKYCLGPGKIRLQYPKTTHLFYKKLIMQLLILIRNLRLKNSQAVNIAWKYLLSGRPCSLMVTSWKVFPRFPLPNSQRLRNYRPFDDYWKMPWILFNQRLFILWRHWNRMLLWQWCSNRRSSFWFRMYQTLRRWFNTNLWWWLETKYLFCSTLNISILKLSKHFCNPNTYRESMTTFCRGEIDDES